MTYNKPDITAIDKAMIAIQSGIIKGSYCFENTAPPPNPYNATATAYEADE